MTLDPRVAKALRDKSSLPHQRNPPREWDVINQLVALRFHDKPWFSDGSTLWTVGQEPWPFGAHAAITGYLKDQRTVHAEPSAFPLGALGGDRMLWGLRWYGPRYTWTPLVLDVTARSVEVLRLARGRAIGGTDPKRLLATKDPNVFVIAGTVDAGAERHLDDFIMVDVAWTLDLAAGSFVDSGADGVAVSGLLAIGPRQAITSRGLEYTALLQQGRGLQFEIDAHPHKLSLDLSDFQRAIVRLG